jgi:hypothetical protein
LAEVCKIKILKPGKRETFYIVSRATQEEEDDDDVVGEDEVEDDGDEIEEE